jgi:hypothetical protein
MIDQSFTVMADLRLSISFKKIFDQHVSSPSTIMRP